MKKPTAYTATGLLLTAVALANGHVYQLPDFFAGLMIGLGLCLMLFGLLENSPAAGRLRAFKKRLLHPCNQ